jgi:hypothetical protein
MLSLDFFIDFTTYVLKHGNSRTSTKCKSLSLSEKLNKINKVGGIPNVPCNKITEKLYIPVRKVTDKMLARSKRGDVLRLLQFTQS